MKPPFPDNPANQPIEIIGDKGELIGLKPKTNRLRHRQAAYIQALRKSFGVVSTASKITGIHRSCHYAWMEQYPDYKVQVEEIQELGLDFAETKLFQRINDGSDQLLMFYLRSKGKKRGYQEEVDINTQQKVTINEVVADQIPKRELPPGTVLQIKPTG